MPVVSKISSKGGVGKTTGSLVFAGELAQSDASVILVDADPNGPLVSWSKRPNRPSQIEVVIDESSDTIVDTITACRARARWVIVDIEGRAEARAGFAASQSDLVLIPVQPSVLDAAEAAKSIRLVRQMGKVAGRTIPVAIYFSRLPTAIRERTFRDIEAQFRDAGVPILPTPIYDRAAYRSIFSIGGTVHTLTTDQVSGLEAARRNSFDFAQNVLEMLRKSREQAA